MSDEDTLRLDALEVCIRDGSYQSIIHDIAAGCQHAYRHFGKGPALRTIMDAVLYDCIANLRAKAIRNSTASEASSEPKSGEIAEWAK